MSNDISTSNKFTEEEKQEILDYRNKYESNKSFIGNDLDNNMLISKTTLLDVLDQFYNNLFSK